MVNTCVQIQFQWFSCMALELSTHSTIHFPSAFNEYSWPKTQTLWQVHSTEDCFTAVLRLLWRIRGAEAKIAPMWLGSSLNRSAVGGMQSKDGRGPRDPLDLSVLCVLHLKLSVRWVMGDTGVSSPRGWKYILFYSWWLLCEWISDLIYSTYLEVGFCGVYNNS